MSKQAKPLINASGTFQHKQTKRYFQFIPFDLALESAKWDISDETGAYNRLIFIPWLEKNNITHVVLVRNDDGWGFLTPSNTRYARVCATQAHVYCGEDNEDTYQLWQIVQK